MSFRVAPGNQTESDEGKAWPLADEPWEAHPRHALTYFILLCLNPFVRESLRGGHLIPFHSLAQSKSEFQSAECNKKAPKVYCWR